VKYLTKTFTFADFWKYLSRIQNKVGCRVENANANGQNPSKII